MCIFPPFLCSLFLSTVLAIKKSSLPEVSRFYFYFFEHCLHSFLWSVPNNYNTRSLSLSVGFLLTVVPVLLTPCFLCAWVISAVFWKLYLKHFFVGLIWGLFPEISLALPGAWSTVNLGHPRDPGMSQRRGNEVSVHREAACFSLSLSLRVVALPGFTGYHSFSLLFLWIWQMPSEKMWVLIFLIFFCLVIPHILFVL